MPRIEFFVTGIPRPGGSKRNFALKKGGEFTGKVGTVDMGKDNARWRADIAEAARREMARIGMTEPFDCALHLACTFYRVQPKSHFTAKGELKRGYSKYPTSAPDTTKLVRALEDALNHVVWRDDSRVVNQECRKRYGDTPGVRVVIATVDEK